MDKVSKVEISSAEQAKEVFESRLGEKLTSLVVSPGRINLIGEHTDYNNGFSLPSAINKYIFIGFVDKSSGGEGDSSFKAEIISIDYDESVILTEVKKQDKLWANYVVGIIDRIGQLAGGVKGNYRAIIAGNLGVGMGISSSAALCCGFAFGLNEILHTGISKEDIALVAQWTEHNYVGTKCGLLDQTANVFSQESSLIKVDFLTGEKSYYKVPFEFSIILLHSGQFHSLSESCYNERVKECRAAANLILLAAKKPLSEQVSLRDCSIEDFHKAESLLPENLLKRAKFVIEENARVGLILSKIQEKNYDEIRNIMNATHEGLSKLYEVSTERLDFLASESNKRLELAFGARLMGGGFGGCTINLVFPGKEQEFIDQMSEAFSSRFKEDLLSISVKLSPGVYSIKY